MVFTFYSYKGGVGRSMAMANVAHWLYLRGLDVVLVDWDLEAPGLESFFYDSADDLEPIRSHLGVIDLLYSYMRQFRVLPKDNPFGEDSSIKDALCTLDPPVSRSAKGRGRLRLLTAGWRSGDRFAKYAESVQAFSWTEFYAQYNGEEYFNWFHRQLQSLGQVILIDSRTGVTEMGGVCTRHLADVVVTLCAPNAQNVNGCLEMVESFQSEELQKARRKAKRDELKFVIAPARVDDADSKGYEEFRDRLFMPLVAPLLPPVFQKFKQTSWDLEIPYKAQYSYREALVTGVSGANEKLDLAYRNLAAHMALFAGETSPLWRACDAELRVLHARAGIPFGERPWEQAEAAFAGLPPEMELAARELLLRLVHYSPQAADLDSVRRATREEIAHPSAAGVFEELLKLGLVRLTTSAPVGPPTFELAPLSLATEWPRLRQWVREEREFLLARQEVAAQARKWEDSQRDPVCLLRETQLAVALTSLESQQHRLNASEREFLAASQEAEAALQRSQAEAAQAERDRQRRTFRTRRIAAAAAFALLAGGGAWFGYSRSDSYQVRAALADGAPLGSDPTVPEFERRNWQLALVAWGSPEEALASARKEPDVPRRASQIAQIAVWLLNTGREEAARKTASEALELVPQDPTEAAYSLAATIPLLQKHGLLGDERRAENSLVSAARSMKDSYRRIDILQRVTALPGFDLSREECLSAALEFSDVGYLIGLARDSNQANDAKMRDRALTAARKLALSIRNERQRGIAIARVIEEDWNPDLAMTALNGVRQIVDLEDRVVVLTQIAKAMPPPENQKIWEEALQVAEIHDPNARINALLTIVRAAPPDSPFAAKARMRTEAAAGEIEDGGLRAHVSSAFADLGDAERSIRIANDLDGDGEKVPALAEVARRLYNKGLKDDARRAAQTLLKIFYLQTRKTSLADDAVTVMPYVRLADAQGVAQTLNSPEAFLALAGSGDDGEKRSALDRARQLTQSLPDEDARRKADLLGQVAVRLARLGQFYESRMLTERLTRPGRLQVYAAILRSRSIQTRPELKKFFDMEDAEQEAE